MPSGITAGLRVRKGKKAELSQHDDQEKTNPTGEERSIRKILLDIAREEKTHVGEFQSLLLREDAEQARELQAGDREVREKTGF